MLNESWMHETAAAILTGRPLPEAATPEEVTFQQRLAEDIGKIHAAARGVRFPAKS